MNAIAEETSVKTPSTRLLDLIQGWGNYVDAENGAYPDTLTPDALADLYQDAGIVFGQDYPDTESEQAAVCKFVVQRILPALYQ